MIRLFIPSPKWLTFIFSIYQSPITLIRLTNSLLDINSNFFFISSLSWLDNSIALRTILSAINRLVNSIFSSTRTLFFHSSSGIISSFLFIKPECLKWLLTKSLLKYPCKYWSVKLLYWAIGLWFEIKNYKNLEISFLEKKNKPSIFFSHFLINQYVESLKRFFFFGGFLNVIK